MNKRQQEDDENKKRGYHVDNIEEKGDHLLY
jgi:hypothetical protein